jgi:polar amino acid transport system substrate-binding protein
MRTCNKNGIEKIGSSVINKRYIQVYMMITFLYGVLSSLQSHAGVNQESKIQSTHLEELKFVTMEQFPYGYKTEKGKPAGIWYDILNNIIQKSGISVRNEITPTKRIVSYYNSNVRSCTLLADNTEKEDNLENIGEIGQVLSAGVLPKNGIKIEKYTDLKNLVIAVPLGIEFYNTFDNDLTINKVRPPQYLNAIKMLSKGRVDAVAGAIPILKYIAKLEGMSEREFGSPLIFITTNVMLVCTKSVNKIVRNKLKVALTELKEEGGVKKILDQYFSLKSQSK